MPKFRVRYVVPVVMEVVLESESERLVIGNRLPGAYDGVSAAVVPREVVEVLTEEIKSIQRVEDVADAKAT